MHRKVHSLLLSGLTILCLILVSPAPTLAQSHELVEQYAQKAEILSKQGDYLEAASMFEESALAMLASPEPILGASAGLFLKAGEQYVLAGRDDKAVEAYQQCLQIARKLGQEKGILGVLLDIAGVHYRTGQYMKAIEAYQQGVEIARGLNNDSYVAVLLNNIGQAYYSLDHYDEAIEYYLQALKIDKRLGREASVASRLVSIGLVYYSWGQYGKAIEYYQQAMGINKKQGNKKELAVNLNNMGLAYYSLGKYEEAVEYYQQGLEINKRYGGEEGRAKTLINIGMVYTSRGRFDEAIDYYQQALEIAERRGKEADISVAINNIGMVYHSRGQFDKAIKYLQRALAIDKKLGREAGIAATINNFGSVYDSWGQYDKAIDYYQQALEINKRLGIEGEIAKILGNIGSIYGLRGQYDKAIEHYQQALNIDRRIGREAEVARDLNNIGWVHQSLGQYDKAIEHYQQALEIDKNLGKATAVATYLNNIGGVYFQKGQQDKAIEYYQQALEIDRRLGKEAEAANWLGNIGTVYYSRSQYDKASEYFRQSIQLLEKIRKTAKGDIRRDYLASQIHAYQALASASLKKGDHQGVLDAVEQSRARLLAERIAGIDSKLDLPTLEEVQQGLADDEAVLLFSNIDKDNFILMVITGKEIAMKEVSKENFLAKSRKQYKKPTLMLLEKQRGLSIHTEAKEDPQAFEENKQQADFETAIHYYRSLLTNQNHQEVARQFGRLLHELLIEPVSEKLAGKNNITIMPDGILGFLPFETLVDENNNYLTQDYDLRYTQSLTIDKLLKGRDYTNRDNRKPLLAMGGAVYDELHYEPGVVDNSKQLALLRKETDLAIEEKRSARSSYARLGMAKWSNLPGTLEEVNELSAIIKEGETLTGEKVSENRIKKYSKSGRLDDYKVLHFATHGLVVPELPELSAIVLSQFREEKGGEDGYLRMGEIAELDLAADFVNLSACETGLGKIYSGEGIVGLTQSFLIAGANGLSVSLWQVADASTAKFMTELYNKVENSGMGYREALTAVKREFINGGHGKQWTAPYYWSPFVYYGN